MYRPMHVCMYAHIIIYATQVTAKTIVIEYIQKHINM